SAKRGAGRCELTYVGGELDLQRDRLAVQQESDVVLVAVAGREPGHDLVGQIVQRGRTVFLDQIGGSGDPCVEWFATTLDEAVGVEQQCCPRWHDVTG